MRIARLFVPIVVATALVAAFACGPDKPAVAPTPAPSAPTTTLDLQGDAAGAPQASADRDPEAGADPLAASDAGPKLCGCGLCAPLPSDDACTTDADCAPSTPCHAPACVAKAKATPKKPGQVCTMMMMCASADANACGCHKGHCALVPKH